MENIMSFIDRLLILVLIALVLIPNEGFAYLLFAALWGSIALDMIAILLSVYIVLKVVRIK